MTDQYMPFFVGDYLRDTMHLSKSQHGQYLLLLCHAWCKGPFDLRKARAVGGRNIDAVLYEFFTQNEDGLFVSKKLEEVKQRNVSIREKRRSAANKRWEKCNANAYANALQVDIQPEPEPNIKEKSKPKKKTGTRFTDAQLSTDWIAACKKINPLLNPQETFETFRDYWIAQPGQKGVKLDWLATWRNWCRRQQVKSNATDKLTAQREQRRQWAEEQDRKLQTARLSQSGTGGG